MFDNPNSFRCLTPSFQFAARVPVWVVRRICPKEEAGSEEIPKIQANDVLRRVGQGGHRAKDGKTYEAVLREALEAAVQQDKIAA